MTLKELIEKMNAEKQIEVQEEERLETLIKKADELEKRINRTKPSLKKRIAGLAVTLGAVALFSAGQSALMFNYFNARIKSIDAKVTSEISAVYSGQKEYYKSAELNNYALKDDPSNIKAKFRLGVDYIHLGDYSKAEEVLKELVAANPGIAPVHKCLADAYFNQRKYALSEGEYKKAIDIDPAYLGAYINLSKLYEILHMDDEAKKQGRIAANLLDAGVYNTYR